MKVYVLLVVSVLASLVPAKHSRIRHAYHTRHERRSESPSHWVKRDAVDPKMWLPMRIGLTQANLERGHAMLMDVSDPTSPNYGQHYSAEQVVKLFAPSNHAVSAVQAWLEEAGITADRVTLSTSKQWLEFDIPAWEAEMLLNTKYYVYEHSETGRTSIGCHEYHVKADVQHHIDYITPGVTGLGLRASSDKIRHATNRKIKARSEPIASPLVATASATTTTSGPCSTVGALPACVQSLYSIPRGTTNVTGNQLGIYAPETYNPDPTDLNDFFSSYASYVPQGTFPTIKLIDGAVYDPTEPQSEPNLDLQTSYPLIYPQGEIFYLVDSPYEAAQKPNGFLNTFLDALDKSYCTYSAYGETGNNNTVDPVYPNAKNNFTRQCGKYAPTHVISISYLDTEYLTPLAPNYYLRQCSEFMKLGMQGISVVIAAGDNGPNGNQNLCPKVNGHQIYNPTYPADCPYITAMGGTQLEQTSGGTIYEVAANDNGFQSGGGFSNLFATPSYQAAAVKAYFASSNAPKMPYYTNSTVGDGIYNRSGRGYPDVSAVSLFLPYFVAGGGHLGYGTSFAAPIFASILTLINEQRLLANKSTVGFVNPVLYQNPQAFTDITSGTNGPGCGNTAGFSTAKGWDPVTGLGTPNYPALLKVFMSLS